MASIKDYSVISSGLIAATAGANVYSGGPVGGGPVCHGLFAISDATNTCVVTLYHGTAVISGNELAKLSIPASTAPPQFIIFNNPIACPDGLFIVVTGTGAKGMVYYSAGS